MFSIYCSVENRKEPEESAVTCKVRGSKTFENIEDAKANCKRIAYEHFDSETRNANGHKHMAITQVSDTCWKVTDNSYIFHYWCG